MESSTSSANTSISPKPVVKSRGKEREVESSKDLESSPEDSASDSLSDTSSESFSGSSEPENNVIITTEYLESLLDKSRQNALMAAKSQASQHEEEVLILEDDQDNAPLPSLNPGSLPTPYLALSDKRHERPLAINDPDIKRAELATSALSAPTPPIPPPELNASGKPLTKKERKALKKQTAGPGWFDLPAPSEADLPQLYREVEALRLRNQLDPKRFYRKDEGEGKGIKGLPKYFAIGTILPTDTPFGAPSTDNLPKSHRKRTLVDELVDDAEAKRYAKKKFEELQTIKGAKGKNTLVAKKASRRPKW